MRESLVVMLMLLLIVRRPIPMLLPFCIMATNSP